MEKIIGTNCHLIQTEEWNRASSEPQIFHEFIASFCDFLATVLLKLSQEPIIRCLVEIININIINQLSGNINASKSKRQSANLILQNRTEDLDLICTYFCLRMMKTMKTDNLRIQRQKLKTFIICQERNVRKSDQTLLASVYEFREGEFA